MTELQPGFADDDACLSARFELVTLRLAAEVNRLRALRGEGRDERFAGVLMRDCDVAALCAELIAAPMPTSEDLAQAWEHAQARYAARLAATPVLPVYERVRELYALSPLEEEIFACCLAVAVDPRLGRVLGYLHEDMAQTGLSVGLAQRLFGVPLTQIWSALGADGVLIRHGILRVDGPLTGRAVIDVPPDTLRIILAGPTEVEAACQMPLVGHPPEGPILIDAPSDLDGLITLGEPGPIWISRGGSLAQVQAMSLLAALNGQGHVITGWDAAPEADRFALMRGLGRLSVVVTQRPAMWSGAGVPWQQITATPSSLTQRVAFWEPLAGQLAGHAAEEGQADPVALWHLLRSSATKLDFAAMLRHMRSEPMQGLADRVPAGATLEMLELPEHQKARLRGFARRRHADAKVLEDWGLGAALGAARGGLALFSGPSGVGKTMAASVVADLAGLDLWRINLATMVSKYIGETEKNLDRVFQAADRAEVVLFFDEADALFGKRAEVKDGRDRYANMEMAYLLQRIESFRGMAILASNMGSSLDPAMSRRFDLVMEFQLPDARLRRRIWGRLEQAQVPLAKDVDLDLLADRFELAGGHIRQAILDAAHAASDESEVTQAHLMLAVARECAKLGRPIRKEDFGAYFKLVRGVG